MAQVSLVAFYQNKSPAFADWLDQLLNSIQSILGKQFDAYSIPQVHATIIGLEATREQGKLINCNFLQLRRQHCTMQLANFLAALETAPQFPMHIQLGGYSKDVNYHFLSQGKTPWERCINIRANQLILIGWPNSNAPILANFRKTQERFGILHKWHPALESADNDCYFVLGELTREHDRQDEYNLLDKIRQQLLDVPLTVPLPLDKLGFVTYTSTRLPTSDTKVLSLPHALQTPESFSALFTQ